MVEDSSLEVKRTLQEPDINRGRFMTGIVKAVLMPWLQGRLADVSGMRSRRM